MDDFYDDSFTDDLTDSLDDTETLSLDDSLDDTETLSLDDSIDDTETLSLDDSIDDTETLSLDDSLDDTETLSLDDSLDDTETLSLDDSLDDTETLSLDDSLDDTETLSLDDSLDDTETLNLDDSIDNIETLNIDDSYNTYDDINGEEGAVYDDTELTGSGDLSEQTQDPIYEPSYDVSNEDLDQALLNHEVYEAPLTAGEYVDDSEIGELSAQEIPPMTDEELATFTDWENEHNNGYYDMIEDIQNDPNLSDDQKEAMIQPLQEELDSLQDVEPEYGARVKGLTYDGRDIITRPPEQESSDFESLGQEQSYPYQFNPEIAPEVNELTTEPERVGEFAPVQGGDGGEWERAMSEMLSYDEHMEQMSDISKPEPLTDEDMEMVYNGLEDYDFQGADPLVDTERLDESLENFTAENWEKMDLNEQKEAMRDLAEYISDAAGLENPPNIEFYNNEKDGDYGGFDRTNNTLYINEHMLYQNDEAADTVAHELWHARQYERSQNPRSKQDLMYAENFNDYITPEEDFEGYQSQILESEARAFANQIKERLHSY